MYNLFQITFGVTVTNIHGIWFTLCCTFTYPKQAHLSMPIFHYWLKTLKSVLSPLRVASDSLAPPTSSCGHLIPPYEGKYIFTYIISYICMYLHVVSSTELTKENVMKVIECKLNRFITPTDAIFVPGCKSGDILLQVIHDIHHFF